MKKSVLVYIYSLVPFAIFFVLNAIETLDTDAWLILLTLTIMFIMLEIMAIRLPSGPVISLTSGLSMVALFCFGMPEAVLSAAVSLLIVSFIKRWEYYRAIYNTSMYIISIYLAGAIFYALNGVDGVMDILVPWPYLGAIAIYFLLNSILTAGLFSLLQNSNIFRIWYKMMNESLKVYIAEQILAFASAFMFLNQGLIGLLLLMSFLLMLQLVFRSHYNLFESEKERAVELEAILNNAESGILMIDRSNNIKMSNKRFGEIFDIKQNLKSSTLQELFQELSARLSDKEIFEELLENSQTSKNIEILTQGKKKRVIKGLAASILEDDVEKGKIVTLTDITTEWEKNKQLRELYESAIRSLAAVVDARDTYTSGHSSRVSDFAVAIGKKIELPDNEIEVLRFAGLLHDIGKIGIDDKILRKKGPLNDVERAKMMEHPAKGVAILEEVHAFKELIPIIKYHHERYDGNGYLEGLQGENIPLGSRIMAVADAFDAMTSNRSYRAALPVEEALSRLISGRGSQFDPMLVDVFVAMIEQQEVNLEKHTAVEPPVPQFADVNLEDELEQPGRILPRHGKVISILYQISLESHSLLQLEVYLKRLLEILHDSLSANLYCIYLNGINNKSLQLKASTGLTHGVDLPGDIQMESDKIREFLELKKPRISKEITEHLLPSSGTAKGGSTEIVVPIIDESELIGLLIVKVFDDRQFLEDELYLLMTLAYQVGQNIKIAQRHHEVLRASKYDCLTDVLNYGQFINTLKEKIKEAQVRGSSLSMCITDINDFKKLNDNYGHLVGDEALKYFASYLKKNTRESDIVARYGGDEFAIIFPHTCYSNAVEIVTRLMAGLSGKKISTRDGSFTFPFTSYGVAAYPDECKDAEDLIHLADSRMYKHKRSKNAEHASSSDSKSY